MSRHRTPALSFAPAPSFVCRVAFAAALWVAVSLVAQAQRLVLIDQDGGGPGGTDQMSMMVLLQSPQVKVLGITLVTGDMWEPEEVQHTLRMLELIHRTDVPVVPGAVFPLLRTRVETLQDGVLYGMPSYLGAWNEGDAAKGRRPYHGPFVVPPLPEGQPTTRPLDEDAAHFLIRQVHAHPHQVTIYAAGPLTNIALALAIDPQFAALTKGIVIMGGSLEPRTDDPEFTTTPRREFNFWFDPEAAHIVLRAPWPRVDLTTVDISVKTRFTDAMRKEIANSHSPAAQYITKYDQGGHYLWDELAAAAWVDPKIITKETELYLDVNVMRGPDYGNTLSWTAANKPQHDMALVHVQQDLDLPRLEKLLVQSMSAPPVADGGAPQAPATR